MLIRRTLDARVLVSEEQHLSNCMVGNSTHTARTNAEAYANTTVDTKYKACNKQEGHFSLSLTVHDKKTCEINCNPKTPGCLAGKAG